MKTKFYIIRSSEPAVQANTQTKQSTSSIKRIKTSLLLVAALLVLQVQAWAQAKTKMAIIAVDTRGVNIDPISMGNLVRLELSKIPQFEIMDRYDSEVLLQKNQIKSESCFGKLCLVEVGKVLGVQKMFSGSVDQLGESIIITFSQIDIATATVEKTQVQEFLVLPKELRTMVAITINNMYGLPNDPGLVSNLTKKFELDNSMNNPGEFILRSDGPRFGVIQLLGHDARIIKRDKAAGGYDAYPTMFQFGYQFEKQYLNQGRLQALFEIIPMVTGIDQGFFIPSLTFLHGIRDNKSGWEFAFGPTARLERTLSGFEFNNQFIPSSQYSSVVHGPSVNIVDQLDSRGKVRGEFGFVIAFGRTFRSGNLNIPLNVFAIPSTGNGWRIGASFGFNAKNRKM